jgi:hypothetical protein
MRNRRAAVAALFISLAAAVVAASAPAGAPAASSGLAWDSVTRVVMGGDNANVQPGSFDTDYATAASAKVPNMGVAARFMGHDRTVAAQEAQMMISSGIAEHHYVAGMKERTDRPALQTATIVDCAARTITALDLANKTYRVTSMDSPSSPSSGGGGSDSSSRSDDDTRVAITIANVALGSKSIGGLPASGYRSDMTITETTSSGQSTTQNANVMGYYSTYGSPSTSCSHLAQRQPGGHGMDMMAGVGHAMQVLGSLGDPRFSVKQSGPPLPLGKLAMFSAMTFSGGGHTGAFVTERGNVRQIDASDPIFSVPPDFTQQH